LGRGSAAVKELAPGKTEGFEITAKVAPGATQCVKGVEYGIIKSGAATVRDSLKVPLSGD
jgi:hypothetical protein